MATDTKQMSRDELQQLAEQTLKRREQQKARQKKIREAKRAAGLRSATFWHPAPPEGYVPVLVFMKENVAKDIKATAETKGTPCFNAERYFQEIKNEGTIKREEIIAFALVYKK